MAEIAAVPNLKVDYVILNAGVLRYPNVGLALFGLFDASTNLDRCSAQLNCTDRKALSKADALLTSSK